MRQITDIAGIAKLFHFVDAEGRPRPHIVYKLVHRPVDPLLHRKIGKHLCFDIERCLAWFDRQDGREADDLYGGVR